MTDKEKALKDMPKKDVSRYFDKSYCLHTVEWMLSNYETIQDALKKD